MGNFEYFYTSDNIYQTNNLFKKPLQNIFLTDNNLNYIDNKPITVNSDYKSLSDISYDSYIYSNNDDSNVSFLPRVVFDNESDLENYLSSHINNKVDTFDDPSVSSIEYFNDELQHRALLIEHLRNFTRVTPDEAEFILENGLISDIDDDIIPTSCPFVELPMCACCDKAAHVAKEAQSSNDNKFVPRVFTKSKASNDSEDDMPELISNSNSSSDDEVVITDEVVINKIKVYYDYDIL
jgi:hypothetical protein